MKIQGVTNLFPRPDRLHFGMYNAQMFDSMVRLPAVSGVNVTVLVPQWKTWKWPLTRRWRCPFSTACRVSYHPVFYLPRIGRRLSPATYARVIAGCLRQEEKSDAVLTPWLYPDGVAAARAARGTAIPVWVMVLGSDTFHLENAARRKQVLAAEPDTAGYICVCELLARRLIDHGVPEHKVHVVPNGVDAALFRYIARDAAAKKMGPTADVAFFTKKQPGEACVLFAGNLVYEKGPDLCLEMLAATRNVRLAFIGTGPMRRQLEQRATELGLHERVRFLGSRPHSEMPCWMALADSLCLSSRSEGMPNVVCEALACGLPVAAFDVGACREMLQGEPCGRLIPPGDTGALAAAIEELIGIKDADRLTLAERHGAYTWQDQAQRVISLMNNEEQNDRVE